MESSEGGGLSETAFHRDPHRSISHLIIATKSRCITVWNTLLLSVEKNKKMTINEITYKINGAIFEVNKVLGAGFLEKIYENALMIELREKGLNAQNQVHIQVNYKDNIVGEYIADIVIEEKVILEIKAIEKLLKVHEAQLLNYLKATRYQIGLLVNFTHPKAIIKRFVL